MTTTTNTEQTTPTLAPYVDPNCTALTARFGGIRPCEQRATRDGLCEEHYERKQKLGR